MTGAGVVTQDIQLGSSPDPTKDFYWKCNNDGTFSFWRGTFLSPLTEVMKINSDGSITGPFLGSGQTEQDMTASRALSTPYTNTTNRPITVYVMCSCAAGAIYDVRLNGTTVFRVGSPSLNGQASFSIPVRPGVNISVVPTAGSVTLVSWWETR